jgi:hypothetical protein
MKTRVLIRGLAVCAVVWLAVVAAQRIFGGMKPSAEKLGALIEESQFADWGEEEVVPDAAEARRREEKLREVAAMVNQLDFRERERIREKQSDRQFFRKLSKPEKLLFFDLTYAESISRMMEALDGLRAEERQEFVTEALEELQSGMAREDMARLEELGDDLLEKAAREGFQVYLEKASAETKMDMAPLMEAMNEAMQGLRRKEWEH